VRRVVASAVLLSACTLGFAAALISPAHGSPRGTCSSAQQAAAQAALARYQSTAAAHRKAYFAKHRQKKSRAAYDKHERSTLARLHAAAFCTVEPTTTTSTATTATLPPTGEPCSPVLDSSGNPTNGTGPLRNAGVRGIGTVNAVMLFVDFPNAPATETTQSAYDTAANGASQFYAAQSYGRVTLNITPVPKWYRMSKPDSDYGFGRGQFTFAQHLAYMQAAASLADPDVDFSKYQILYVVSTKNAPTINYSPAFDANRDPSSAVKADGNLIYGGAAIGSDIYVPTWHWRVLAHETGHVFGMPDYYDGFNPSSNYQQQFHYAGGWTIMSWNTTGAEFFAWDKYREGWIDPSQVRCQDTPGSTTETITPVENPGGIKMIVAKTGPSTAVVAEVRALTGGDAGLCSSGVLVYTLDARALSGQGPLQIQTGHPGDPANAALVDRCAILWDAPLRAGESWQGSNIKVEVLVANADGSYNVRVTHD
jgi:M6 family metalloprotease-like protein